jgi:hypothetical protein
VSRDASFVSEFGGEERTFRLPIGRLRAVQERTDAGPLELLRRFESGSWRVDDLREVILQGLIGGGVDQGRATKLIVTFFDGQPLLQFVSLAQAIVLVAVVGAPDEDEDKADDKAAKPGETEAATTSRTARSASGDSTASPPPSLSTPAPSIN